MTDVNSQPTMSVPNSPGQGNRLNLNLSMDHIPAPVSSPMRTPFANFPWSPNHRMFAPNSSGYGAGIRGVERSPGPNVAQVPPSPMNYNTMLEKQREAMRNEFRAEAEQLQQNQLNDDRRGGYAGGDMFYNTNRSLTSPFTSPRAPMLSMSPNIGGPRGLPTMSPRHGFLMNSQAGGHALQSFTVQGNRVVTQGPHPLMMSQQPLHNLGSIAPDGRRSPQIDDGRTDPQMSTYHSFLQSLRDFNMNKNRLSLTDDTYAQGVRSSQNLGGFPMDGAGMPLGSLSANSSNANLLQGLDIQDYTTVGLPVGDEPGQTPASAMSTASSIATSDTNDPSSGLKKKAEAAKNNNSRRGHRQKHPNTHKISDAQPASAGSEVSSSGKGAKKKGSWTSEEDELLSKLVNELGAKNWTVIAERLPGRVGKQCRERWYNHLDPDLRKDWWTPDEDELIIRLHQEVGNKWAEMAKQLNGRTANSIKNHWNSTIRRRLQQEGRWDLLDGTSPSVTGGNKSGKSKRKLANAGDDPLRKRSKSDLSVSGSGPSALSQLQDASSSSISTVNTPRTHALASNLSSALNVGRSKSAV